MPSSTRKFKCRCSKCFDKYCLDKNNIGMWLNVEYVSHTATYVVLKCRNCGHSWKSRSKAAFRYIKG